MVISDSMLNVVSRVKMICYVVNCSIVLLIIGVRMGVIFIISISVEYVCVVLVGFM